MEDKRSAFPDENVSVLVIGGGLVGLSAAVFLAWRGVPTVLVERHPGSSPHPRAIGYTPRTLELFRAVGLGPRVPQVEAGEWVRRVKVESLTGKWFEETSWTPETQTPKAPIEYSPCRGAAIAQDLLEPILRDKAIELGADVRLETELIRFEQDAGGVTAWLRERGGREYTMRAAYVVAADGHRSQVREALGISRSGRGFIRTVRSVLFRAPLDQYRAGFSQFMIKQPGLDAFLTTYGDGRWVLISGDDQERDEETLRAMICQAIGKSDLEIEIITTGRWEMSGLAADSFSSGRVFLAGDAAHTLPPNRGGYGANTGIDDVHNLAWKLGAVLSGLSTAELLNTYDAERRPIARLRHDQIFAREDYKAYAGEAGTGAVPIIDDEAMEFGQLYRSSAVLGAGDELPSARRPEQWTGQPGTRAPHLWVSKGDERLSTLDLFQRCWVLLTEDERWSTASAAAASQLQGLRLECLLIGVEVVPFDLESFRNAFGLGPDGASLVRPDGYVAWRSTNITTDPSLDLANALRQVLSSVSL